MKRSIIFGLTIFSSVFFLAYTGHINLHIHGSETHTHDNEHSVSIKNDYFGAYDLEDQKFGTKTKVTLVDGKRIMVTNALPNHSVGEFPNHGNPNTIVAQKKTYSFPLIPKYTGKPEWVREPGIALNGVKFEPGTAEVVVCETGENYRVEAFQNTIDLGLDFNNAHVQPTGEYHYHGTPTGVVENFDSGEDLVHIGFAHDGFPMYYSKSNKYKPSYKLVDGTREGENCSYERPGLAVTIDSNGHHDGTFGSDFEFVPGSGQLDECNGITIDGNYMYLVTKEFPYVSRCLMGENTSSKGGGGRERGGGPRIADLFKEMDNNADKRLSIEEVKGPLKQNFNQIDSNKDSYLSKEELEQHKPRY